MSIPAEVIEQIRIEVRRAPRGQKATVVARWAEVLKADRSTIYSHLSTPGGRKRKAAPQRPEYWEWTHAVWEVKLRPAAVGAGPISTDQAVAAAVREGTVPASALHVPVATFDRIARALGLSKASVRRFRYQATRPNEAHHFDASGSKYLYVARKAGDEYVLRIHRPGAMGYKNKPIPVERLRPWYYGLVDDYSGRLITRCTVAQGESMADSLLFLEHAWSQFGLPGELLADQGVLKRGMASSDLIARLDVGLRESMPYAKESHGKIERPWRTLWQRFEKPFFIAKDWERFEITLTELNERLVRALEEYNSRPHRWERKLTRMDAWKKVNLLGGIVEIPENALATVARRKKRKVGVDGVLWLDGTPYEVKGLHDAWVYVYEGVFDSRMVVQEIETGVRHEVRDFRPNKLGQYKAAPVTPHEAVLKTAAAGGVSRDALPYGPGEAVAAASTNTDVVRMLDRPMRTREVREIEDPLNASVHPSADEAYREFAGIVGVFIPPDMREEVIAEIEANGRDKDFVRSFALDVRAAMERQTVNG